jgi:hypothetical protein
LRLICRPEFSAGMSGMEAVTEIQRRCPNVRIRA